MCPASESVRLIRLWVRRLSRLICVTRFFREQLPEDLAERRLPAAQLRDGAVIRHLVKKVEPQVPPQGNIRLDALFDLPFRRDAIQEAY